MSAASNHVKGCSQRDDGAEAIVRSLVLREQQARNAMRDARIGLDPVKPDGQRRNSRGELELWLTAERVGETTHEVFIANDLAVELVAAKVAGNTMSTTWRWVHHTDALTRWESPTTEIALGIEYGGDLGATSASKAAITAGRKAYCEELLGIRKASAPLRELDAAMVGSRDAVSSYLRWMLCIYCQRAGVTEAAALTSLIGVVRGEDGGAPTLEGLRMPHLGPLWMVLATRMADIVTHDPGESPAGMDAPEDELPEMTP